MGWLRQWWSIMFGVAPDPAPDEPSARVAFRIAEMTPEARIRAEALRADAIADFGSAGKADEWLCYDVPFLGGRKPIDIMHTRQGASDVDTALHNMRYGVYS